MITTTSYPLYTPATSKQNRQDAAPSLIPLYHQFIYSIKIFNYLPSENRVADLGSFLNEQTTEASRIRVHILKIIASQLNIPPTTLRINWIEKFNNETSDESAYERILISLSNTNLLDMQNSYSAHLSENDVEKVSEMNFLYEKECSKYFEFLSAIHTNREFSFNINFLQLMYPNETFFRQDQNYEQVEKVQLLKLCDIKDIYSILSLGEDDAASNKNPLLPRQFNLANSLIKRSSEEILFDNSPIDLVELNSTEGVTDYLTEQSGEFYPQQIVKLKSDSSQNGTNATQVFYDVVEEKVHYSTMADATVGQQLVNWLERFKDKCQRWFWSVVPEEDVLLVVIVPAVIVVSLIIFTIVTVCILQMCNKDLKDAKKISKPYFLIRKLYITLNWKWFEILLLQNSKKNSFDWNQR